VTRLLSIKQSFLVGFTVLLTLGIASTGLFLIARQQGALRSTYELSVMVADAQDVRVGTPVRLQGIEVGQVSALQLGEDNKGETSVLLTVRLDEACRSRLFTDASAEIASRGLLGQGVVVLRPGKVASGSHDGSPIVAQSKPDLAAVAARLDSVATEAEGLLKDIRAGKGTIGKLLKDDELYFDLKLATTDARKLMSSVNGSVDAVQGEIKGLKDFVRNGKEAVAAIKQDADAIKSLPIVRSYIEDPVSVLVRPNCRRERKYYPEEEFFEPGRSVLNSDGKGKLDKVAAWLNANGDSNSEVVVVVSTGETAGVSSAAAKKLTEKQAQAVVDYLRECGVHKLGFWTRRKVTAMGLGQDPLPIAEKESIPQAAVQIMLFVPEE
jgi:phospholipid/cholesterol/gamma-HCH transport system substrate-binding protein